jgi:hypothetical protein
MTMASNTGRRLCELEAQAAKRAAKRAEGPAIDYSKLSDAVLEEIIAARPPDGSGKLDTKKLSTKTLREIMAAEIERIDRVMR